MFYHIFAHLLPKLFITLQLKYILEQKNVLS